MQWVDEAHAEVRSYDRRRKFDPQAHIHVMAPATALAGFLVDLAADF